MNSMINEKAVTFKDIEREIFKKCCEVCCDITTELLEKYDEYIFKSRDKALYRDKGVRQSSVKTIYGSVPYCRHVYRTRDEYGINHHIYLLDNNLKLQGMGLISENYAELLIASITDSSYRSCASKATQMTGLPISHTGVWNIIQRLGEKLEEDEADLREADKKGQLKGSREVPVLFEEADGVWLNLQGKDRKARKYPKAEMKAAIAYDGWKEEGKGRYKLDGKVVTAGFEKSVKFQKTRESMIAAEYNLDEVGIRLLNGDGATWIKKVHNSDTIFQLDPFHRNKSVREKLSHTKAVHDVMGLLENEKIDDTFDYLDTYRNSLDDDSEIEKVDDLIKYFKSNREGLIPYQKRGLKIPESPEGLVYKNMGTMENHIWSIIARRMKHNHTSWSIKGGNHLAKILAKKCSGKHYQVIEKLKIPTFSETLIDKISEEILSAGQIKQRIGHGYVYPISGSMAYSDMPIRGDGHNRYWND